MKNDEYYTPEPIMEIIDKYVEEKYGYNRKDFIKPFFPGGDYEKEDYTGKIVVDNPPFSILSKIVDYYIKNDIKFFLFAQSTTVNVACKDKGVSIITIVRNIVYKNGAEISTCFITNIPEKAYIVYDRELNEKIKEIHPYKSFTRTIPDFINASIIRADKITEPIYLDDYEFVAYYDGHKILGGGYMNKKSKYLEKGK